MSGNDSENAEPGTDHVEIVSPSGTVSHTQPAPKGQEGTIKVIAVGSKTGKIIETLTRNSKKKGSGS